MLDMVGVPVMQKRWFCSPGSGCRRWWAEIFHCRAIDGYEKRIRTWEGQSWGKVLGCYGWRDKIWKRRERLGIVREMVPLKGEVESRYYLLTAKTLWQSEIAQGVSFLHDG